MQLPDYAARALRADEQAQKAPTAELAKGWRDLAETYRQLAAQHWMTQRVKRDRSPEPAA
jgi:hypothetical protein